MEKEFEAKAGAKRQEARAGAKVSDTRAEAKVPEARAGAKVPEARAEAKVPDARAEKLTPFTPFYGRMSARIPVAEATGIRFWLITFAEHGLFIAGNLPCSRTDLIREAEGFSDCFYNLLGRLDPRRTEGCLDEAVRGANAMICFLERLVQMEVAGELASTLPPSVYVHMIDETRRFVLIATQPYVEPLGAEASAVRPEGVVSPLVNLLQAEYFWLHDQSDHAIMLQQAVEPAHMRYMEEARAWERVLGHLGAEANVLMKMATANPSCMPAAVEFTRNAVAATTGMRDFSWDTFRLRETSQLLGNQPALLAYHMARESEHARIIMESLAGYR